MAYGFGEYSLMFSHEAGSSSFIFAFGAYELPMLLGSTLPKALPVETYISFANPDLRQRPYSMAMNGVLLLVSLIFAIIYLLCTRRLVRKLGGKR